MELRRLVIPIIVSALGIWLTFEMVEFLGRAIFQEAPAYDIVPLVPGGMMSDITTVVGAVIPVTLLIYIILTVPLAFIYTLGNRMAKLTSYRLGIVEVGESFGTRKILQRAVAPALFSLTFAQVLLAVIPDFIIREPPVVPQAIRPLFMPLFAILASLVVLVVAIALYAPTWALSDSGVIYYLRPEELAARRCPDMTGVGRWVSNFLGGYSLLGYPVSAFFTHFYRPFVLMGVDMTPLQILTSVFWTVGLPFLMIAFVLPAVIVHEFVLRYVRGWVRGAARVLGASHIRPEEVVAL